YQRLLMAEMERCIEDWWRYLPTLQSGGAVPEKFEWLRYVLCTRDGQAILAAKSHGPQALPRPPREQFDRLMALCEEGLAGG
ncbi:MAG: hypothetical protein ABT940_13070, partial [Alphaproteobacteria bacterium]